MRFSMQGKARSSGFSLIEMLIVVVVISIALAITFPLFSKAVLTTPNAQALQSVFRQATNAWLVYTTELNLPVATAANPLIGNSSNTALDVLVNGDNPAGLVSSTYKDAFALTGIKPMSDVQVLSAVAVGTPGSYAVNGHSITFNVNSSGIATMTFTKVDDPIVRKLYSKFSNATYNGSVAMTSGPVQWTAAATDGTHTLTLQTNL